MAPRWQCPWPIEKAFQSSSKAICPNGSLGMGIARKCLRAH